MSEYIKKYEGKDYRDLAKAVKALQKKYDEAKKKSTALKDELDALTINVIPDKLAQDGLDGVKVKGIGRIQLSSQAWCSTKAGMGPVLQEWLKENGYEDIIVLSVNSSTLKAFIKDLRESGEPTPPDEVVNFEPYMRASVVKG